MWSQSFYEAPVVVRVIREICLNRNLVPSENQVFFNLEILSYMIVVEIVSFVYFCIELWRLSSPSFGSSIFHNTWKWSCMSGHMHEYHRGKCQYTSKICRRPRGPLLSLERCSPVKMWWTWLCPAQDLTSRIMNYQVKTRQSSHLAFQLSFSSRLSCLQRLFQIFYIFHRTTQFSSHLHQASRQISYQDIPFITYSFFLLITPTLKMKNVLSVAACLTLAQALPTTLIQRDVASVTFNGAAGAGYTINVPLDGTSTPTSQSPHT